MVGRIAYMYALYALNPCTSPRVRRSDLKRIWGLFSRVLSTAYKVEALSTLDIKGVHPIVQVAICKVMG